MGKDLYIVTYLSRYQSEILQCKPLRSIFIVINWSNLSQKHDPFHALSGILLQHSCKKTPCSMNMHLICKRQISAHCLFTHLSSWIFVRVVQEKSVCLRYLESFRLFLFHCLLSASSVSSGGSGNTKPSVIL